MEKKTKKEVDPDPQERNGDAENNGFKTPVKQIYRTDKLALSYHAGASGSKQKRNSTPMEHAGFVPPSESPENCTACRNASLWEQLASETSIKILPETHFDETYEILKKMGSGGYGSVFHCKNKLDNSSCAVKRVPIKSGKPTDLTRKLEAARDEVRTLVCLQHPNVVRYMTSFFVHNKQRNKDVDFVFQMESLDMSLHDFLVDKRYLRLYEGKKQVNFSQALGLVNDIMNGLQHVHNRGFVHQDIKPHNLLVDAKNMTVKITDFGVSTRIVSGVTNVKGGTKRYSSPEQLTEKVCCAKSDVYSAGLVWVDILDPSYAWKSREMKLEEFKQLREGDYDIVYKNIPGAIDRFPDVRDLLQRMLHPTPMFRDSSSETVQSLQRMLTLDSDGTEKEVRLCCISSSIPKRSRLAEVILALEDFEITSHRWIKTKGLLEISFEPLTGEEDGLEDIKKILLDKVQWIVGFVEE